MNNLSRITTLFNNLRKTKFRIDSERAVLITESYQSTIGEPYLIRRAKALLYILQNQSIGINQSELIIGMQTGEFGGVPVFPEMAIDWLEKDIINQPTYGKNNGEDIWAETEVISEIQRIIPYWEGRTLKDRIYKRMPDPAIRARNALLFNLSMHEDSGLGHVLMDYSGFFYKGFAGIINDVEERLTRLNLANPEDFQKYLFWQAVLIVCKASLTFANRYAAEARRVAAKTRDSTRRKELLHIGKICDRVPENPPQTFQEALQSCWFVQLIAQIETNGSSISLGRFDHYMLPFLRRDINTGVLEKADAQELLECFFIKLSEIKKARPYERKALHGGSTRYQNLTIGGQDADGVDTTNELTYMVLNARHHLNLVDPQLSLRIHPGTPHALLRKAVDLISMGGGHPALFSDSVIIPSLLSRGIPLNLARDYAIIGCVETGFPGLWGRCDGGYTNLPKTLQLALNNGIDSTSGEQIGLASGAPNDLNSLRKVINAYRNQLDYIVNLQVLENNIIDQVHSEFIPHIFISCFVPGCLEKGLDVTMGGAFYNWTSLLGVGIANVANSISALNDIVYEKKEYTIEQIIAALQNNFEEEDTLLYSLQDAPKYGNDICSVDNIAREVAHHFFSCLEKHRTPRGGCFVPSLYSLTSNIPLGKVTGATPDGRRDGQPFAEGISPVQGTDVSGPTASLKSSSNIDLIRATGGVILNQKFSPQLLKKPKDREKFINLIKTYLLDLGGMEVQYNVISKEQLLKAQQNPELFPNLIVRVTGYSAYFSDLSKEVQDDIIHRTEY
jgi:pyruvate formate-lyase/glycerol dehydratase family glycyl radical enzyme